MTDTPERIALVEMFGTYALWNSRDFALQKPVAQYVRAEAAEAALAAKDAEIARLRDALTGIKRAATARRGGWSGEDHEYYFHTSSAALEDTP